MLSRQRLWQIEKEKQGLCSSCGQPRLFKTDLCFRHYVLRDLRRHGIRLPLSASKALHRRREKMLAEMRARYQATVFVGATPAAVDLWAEYNFRRAKDAGLKVARLLERLDNRALREFAAKPKVEPNEDS